MGGFAASKWGLHPAASRRSAWCMCRTKNTKYGKILSGAGNPIRIVSNSLTIALVLLHAGRNAVTHARVLLKRKPRAHPHNTNPSPKIPITTNTTSNTQVSVSFRIYWLHKELLFPGECRHRVLLCVICRRRCRTRALTFAAPIRP